MTIEQKKPIFEYQKLKKQIVSQISSNTLKPGDKLPSLRTLATTCGLSLAPVRQAIQELDAEGYIVRYHGKGVFVNTTSRPAQNGTNEIALVVPGIDTNETYARMVQQMQGCCRKSGYRQIVFSIEKSEDQTDILAKLPELGVSGAVIFPSENTETTRILKKLRRRDFPFVIINTSQPLVPAPCVTPNNFMAGCMAAAHLTEWGHKKIAMVGDSKNFEFNDPKYQGYLRALEQAGVEPVRSLVAFPKKTLNLPAELINWGQTAAEQLLAAHPDLTAFISTPIVAAGMCKTLLAAGKKIPEDISLVCLGTSTGYLMATNIPPDVTAIEMNETGVITKAVDCVIKEIEQGLGPAEHVQVPCEFIPGATTARIDNGP